MKKIIPGYLFLFLVCLAFNNKASAQDTTVPKNKWHYFLEPYVMFPNMKGTVGMGNLPNVDVNASVDDVFSHLQFGAMLYFEAHNDKWAISSDILYMDLQQDVDGKRGILTGKLEAKQFAWEIAGLRKVRPWLELGAGFRINSLKSGLELNVDSTILGGGQKSSSLTETWVDPIIVGRLRFPAGKKWLFQLRGDIGGFGVGSKLAWQLQADVSYRFSKLFDLDLGYRSIYMDYEKGSGSDRFLYDMNIFGPVLRFGFTF